MKKAIILILDKSGSMGSQAVLKNSAQKEEDKVTSIQLQSHCSNTVIKSIHSQLADTIIGVVTFDSKIEVLQIPSSNYDVKELCKKIDEIEDGSATNMWGAIEMGIELANNLIKQDIFVEIFLLTDGLPTPKTNPMRGILHEFKKIVPKNNFRMNTFGIGSDIDSNLLYQIANIGNGIFKYISDAGMVGTCIINSAAKFILDNKTEFKTFPIPIFDDIVKNLGTKNCKEFSEDDLKMVQTQIKNIPKEHPIYLDMEQIEIGCSSLEHFQNWGAHYYRTLKSSHENKHCGNFKDLGLQQYADEKMQEMQTIIEKIFKGEDNTNDKEEKKYEAYINPYGGCVNENDLIVLANGNLMRIGDLKRGDQIKSTNGKIGIVEWVLICENIPELLSFSDILHITPWHPIKVGEEWKFPNELFEKDNSISKIINKHNVVTIALKDVDTYTFFIENYECIALNHNITDNEVLKHEFYGTQRVINYIQSLDNSLNGRVYDNKEKRNEYILN